jgi:hypothetical protein
LDELYEEHEEKQKNKNPYDYEHFSPFDADYEEIPKEFWSSKNTDWEKCAVWSEHCHYIHIYLEFEPLRKLFPAHKKVTKTVDIIAGKYVTYDKSIPANAKRASPGRPIAYDYAGLYIQLTKLVLNDEINEKQESIIATLQAWHKRTHPNSDKPSRATIQKLVKQYKDEFGNKPKI